MKCNNCHKNIGRKDEFCSNCGEKIIREEKVKIPRKKHQIFKIIIMVFLTILTLLNLGLLILVETMDPNEVAETISNNKDLLVLNLLTFFMPLIFIFLVAVGGWIVVLGISIVGVIISLLTMIKATKKKKIYLGIIILILVIIAVIAAVMGPKV